MMALPLSKLIILDLVSLCSATSLLLPAVSLPLCVWCSPASSETESECLCEGSEGRGGDAE